MSQALREINLDDQLVLLAMSQLRDFPNSPTEMDSLGRAQRHFLATRSRQLFSQHPGCFPIVPSIRPLTASSVNPQKVEQVQVVYNNVMQISSPKASDPQSPPKNDLSSSH